LSAPDCVRDLRDEIGIVRRLLELTIARTKNEAEFTLVGPKVVAYAKDLAQLKKINQQLEQNHGQLLSKSTVAKLASRFMEIVIKEIDDLPDFEARVDRILGQVSRELESAKDRDDDPTTA
jgi:hypothetical protein